MTEGALETEAIATPAQNTAILTVRLSIFLRCAMRFILGFVDARSWRPYSLDKSLRETRAAASLL
jgi:hypothetical protein